MPGQISTDYFTDTDAIICSADNPIDGVSEGAYKIGTQDMDIEETSEGDLTLDIDNIEHGLNYGATSERFSEIRLYDFDVMPDHIHLMIHIVSWDAGADRCVCPHSKQGKRGVSDIKKDKHAGLPLHRVIQWFRTMTTNEYIRCVTTNKWPPFNKRLWQRNYHDQIIRNRLDMTRIHEYINRNPETWNSHKKFAPEKGTITL